MGKKASAGPKPRKRLTRATVKQLLDLSASESEGRPDHSDFSSLTEMSDGGSRDGPDSDNPILVDDNMDAKSDDEAVEVTSGPTPVKRKRLHRRTAEPDEEVPNLDPDDSMYSKTSGLKSSLLGPPLQTRSSKALRDNVLKDTLPNKKKRRKNKSPSRSEESTAQAQQAASGDRAISWSPTPPPGWTSSKGTALSESPMVSQLKPSAVSAEMPISSVTAIGTDGETAPASSSGNVNAVTAVPVPSLQPASVGHHAAPITNKMEIMFQAQNAQLQQLMTLIATREAASAIPGPAITTHPASVSAPSSTPSSAVASATDRPTVPLAPAFSEEKRATTSSSQVLDTEALQGGGQPTEAPRTPEKSKDKGKGRLQASDDDLNIPDDFRGLDFDIISVFSPKKNKDGDEDATANQSNHDASPSPQKKKKTVVYSDVVYPRVKYNDKGPCQVFRPELQDPLLVKVYAKAPSLVEYGQLVPTYDPASQKDPAGSIGGRLSFSIWFEVMFDANPVTIMHAVSIVAHDCHVNGSLANPNDMCIMPLPGIRTYHIIGRNERPAVFMSAGMCTESHIIHPEGSSSANPRYSKSIGLIMHNLHYERFVQFCLICLGHKILRTAIRNRALLIQSVLSPLDGIGKDQQKALKKTNKLTKFFDSPGGSPSKAGQAAGPTPAWVPGVSYPEKYKLEYNDKIPAYDARGTLFNFQSDLANLSKLKEWEGEVPVGAFVVVGHSVSTYKGTANGEKGVWHLGNNLLWVVICGTTGDDESDGNSDTEPVD
ncbi:hypothetical protein B0H16DRAFT_1710648 [Mycena metata]|uniref:Uncharacterized protein n=1 Tax=Mycena metata TaxID=1033252 RepID=A0AAD7NZH0_9AGAR|nr:hypothetical protein B0H16DRAFT_1710648 [Mycena metata]